MTKPNVTLADINTILPQTQCERCGYPGCKPYAEAILSGTPHNQCPPGGQRVIAALSTLLGREELPLNPENGSEGPRQIAVIREDECIGCTKCIQACPVDAIAGTGKMMHTVIAQECTGCELCIEPCPVDCIDLITAPDSQQPDALTEEKRFALQAHYQTRYERRQARRHRQQQEQFAQYQKNKTPKDIHAENDKKAKKRAIEEALARVKAKRQ